jgi:hypothetical protein
VIEETFSDIIYNTLLKTYASESGSRSSKRTDYLHEGFEKLVRSRSTAAALYSARHEESVISGDGKFKIDLLLEGNGGDAYAFLLKLVGSSYNKNRKNYMNTVIGEVYRYLAHSPERRKVMHVNIIPRRLPRFNKGGEVTATELSKVNDLGFFYRNLPPAFEGRTREAVMYFTIDEDVLNAPTRHDLHERLLKAGPSSVRIENYEDFCKCLEDFIE